MPEHLNEFFSHSCITPVSAPSLMLIAARVDPPADGLGLLGRARDHRSREPVEAVVGEADGLVRLAVLHDRHDRPEGLLLHHLHVLRDVDEHRRAQPLAAMVLDRATRQDACPACGGGVDLLLHDLRLAAPDERPELALVRIGPADAHAGSFSTSFPTKAS